MIIKFTVKLFRGYHLNLRLTTSVMLLTPLLTCIAPFFDEWLGYQHSFTHRALLALFTLQTLVYLVLVVGMSLLSPKHMDGIIMFMATVGWNTAVLYLRIFPSDSLVKVALYSFMILSITVVYHLYLLKFIAVYSQI